MTEPAVSIPAFLPFYLSLAPRSAVSLRLGEPIAGACGTEHADTLLDEVWQALIGHVEGHSFRVLIGTFHEFRENAGLPLSVDSDAALRAFTGHLGDPANVRAVLERYPVLGQRLETIVANSLDAYADLFTAYAKDRAGLIAAGLLSGGDVTVSGLFATGGDLHNDNRQVVGVHLADGTDLVYKPRTLISDQFVRDLYTTTDPWLTYSLRECLPRSVTIGEHGWQQFVTPRPMTDPAQPARYFYRFGALCALAGAIGASDLHDENLLAAGENPCMIDTETMIRPNTGVLNDSLPHLLINQLKLSIATTMLVPMTDPNSRIDLIMAGVGVDGVQTSKMKRPMVSDGTTDGIRVRWENITYRHKDNVPRLGDTALSPLDHFDDIMAGYGDALAAVRDDALGKVLDNYPDMPIRCLIRSTMVYTRFLDAATHPDYLGGPERAERLLRLLGQYPDYLTPAAAEYVGIVERASLHTGNVPYFRARAGSTELGTPASALPGVHPMSPLDFARAGVALSARRSDAFHRFLMEECLSELAGDESRGLADRSLFAPAIAGATAGGWWPEIARTIDSVGVSFDGPDGPETGWVCGIGPNRQAPTVTPGNFISFHDSGGLVTFLRNAARHAPELGDAATRADRGLDTLLREYDEILIQAPEGVFTGAASLLLARPETVDGAWLDRTLDMIDQRVQDGPLDVDLANGPAGALMVLLSRIEAGADPLIGERRLAGLVRLVRGHAERTLPAPWFDVAHGELGMRWAAARIGRVLGDSALTGTSAAWLSERLAGDDRTPVNGWCKGAAGVLLASAEILSSAGRAADGHLSALVDAATALPAGRPVDLSVCHGTSGVVQALLATARTLGDRSLVDRALDYQARVITAARRDGFTTGTRGRTSLLGYMFGWSGIADTDLMLHAAGGGDDSFAIPVAFSAPPAP